jgi:hypothetical protein
MASTFWVSGNIIFDLETGHTRQVLMLVTQMEDATTFNADDVETYLSFVSRRAKHIKWTRHESKNQPGYFVIRGEQSA